MRRRREAKWSKNKKTETSTKTFLGSTMNTCPTYCPSETRRYVHTFHLSPRDEKIGLKNARFPIMKRPSWIPRFHRSRQHVIRSCARVCVRVCGVVVVVVMVCVCVCVYDRGLLYDRIRSAKSRWGVGSGVGWWWSFPRCNTIRSLFTITTPV